MLFVSRFPFDFYPVDNDGLYLIVYRIKNAIVTNTNAIAFFFCEFFRTVWSWIGSKGKNCFINGRPIFCWNLFRLFFCLAFYYNLVGQFLSHVLRNLSYGMKEVASLSALRRSLASSRSSINSMMLLYSLMLRTTAFLLPFSSTRYLGFTVSVILCIFTSNCFF
jgi:hypothetical protein